MLNFKNKIRATPTTAMESTDKKYQEFRERLKIDRDSLDEEVSQQPFLLMQVSEWYSGMVSRRDKLKEETELLASKLSMKIREQKSKSDGRVTDKEVVNRVDLLPEYRQAVTKYHGVSEETAKWFYLREAFISKGYMLREMCNLFGSQYWSKSAVTSGNAGDSVVSHVRRETMRGARPKTL